jgi:hypothetical protein
MPRETPLWETCWILLPSVVPGLRLMFHTKENAGFFFVLDTLCAVGWFVGFWLKYKQKPA